MVYFYTQTQTQTHTRHRNRNTRRATIAGRGHDTHVKVVDNVLRCEVVDHAHEEREGRVVKQVLLDVVQQSRLGQVLDVAEPVL